jgi:MarR family transcriptional regulator, organic hydroperoxide resistance regulator
MVDLRRVLSDVTRVQAQLEAGVNLRLRSELGLSLVLFDSMTVIGEVEACRVQDLAAALYVSAGGASKLVDRLAALGYCRRLPNPDDRRSSLLRLTPIGQQRLTAAGRLVDEELERLLGPRLSVVQISEFAAVLQELRRAPPLGTDRAVRPPSSAERRTRPFAPPLAGAP